MTPPLLPSSSVHVRIWYLSGPRHIADVESSCMRVLLADKILEYLDRFGDFNGFCFNIAIQLLPRGKVTVDSRNSADRGVLVDKADVMSRSDATAFFDGLLTEHTLCMQTMEAKQQQVMETPRDKFLVVN